MSPNKNFEKMLKAAYHYYWLDDNIISDYEYDWLTKLVYAQQNLIDHPAKELVDFKALEKCSSLHYIPKKSYPQHKHIDDLNL